MGDLEVDHSIGFLEFNGESKQEVVVDIPNTSAHTTQHASNSWTR